MVIATRENTIFVVHLFEIKFDLTLKKKSNIFYRYLETYLTARNTDKTAVYDYVKHLEIYSRQIFRVDFLVRLLSILYYNALCTVFEASLQRAGCGPLFVAVCLFHVGLL